MAKVGQHRPRITFGGGKWRRSKHSRLFKGPVMLNPRRRSRRRRRSLARFNPFVSVRYPHRRRHARRNPFNLGGIKTSLKRVTNKAWLMNLVTISGGIAAGMAGKSVFVNLMPKIGLGSFTQYAGAGNILLGSILVGMGKKKLIKEIGITMAAVGMYDLIASMIPQYLPTLPSVTIPGLGGPVSGSYSVPTLPVSPVAALSASYPGTTRAGYAGSYMAPDMRTEGFHGDENPYDGIFE